jgi:hypothetical protein
MRCDFPLSTRCANGHPFQWRCHDRSPTCRRCEQERKAAEEAKAKQTRLLERREAERGYYQQEMSQLNKQLARLKCEDEGISKDGTPKLVFKW